MKMKRIITGLLCACMLTSLASCGKKDVATVGNIDITELGDTGGIELPITTEDVELQAFVVSSVADLPNKFFLKNLKEITGVTVKPIVVTGDTGLQKLQLLAASKKLPDISCNFLYKKDVDDLGMNGALVNITENIDKMPNIKKLFFETEENKRIIKDLSSPDGNMYLVPSYNIARDINHLFMYRKDIFDKLGIEPWTDSESFYNALKKIKEAYPDSTPFSSKLQFDLIRYFANQWGIEFDLDGYYNRETGKWEYAGTSDRMKEMLDFIKKLYDEKLFDPEFLTNTAQGWSTKMTTDKAFVSFDWVDRMDMFKAQTATTIPDFDLQPGFPIGTDKTYTPMDKLGAVQVFIANNKNAEISMKLVDFLMSEAGSKLATVGLQGETYNYDENGKANFIGFEDGSATIATLEEAYGMYTQGLAIRYNPECVYFQFTERTQKAQDLVNEKKLVRKVFPKLNMNEDTDRYNELYSVLYKEFQEFASKYILGSGDVSWEAWVEEAKGFGSEEFAGYINKHAGDQTR